MHQSFLSRRFWPYISIINFCTPVVLWSGCFTTWIEMLTRGKVNLYRWTDCKLGFFLFFFGKHFSSMLLVLMSLEKCFAVYFPLRAKTVCTVKTAKWATGVAGVILAAINLCNFFFFEAQFSVSYSYYVCVPSKYYPKSFRFSDSVLYSFAPFTLMFFTTFAIAFRFLTAKSKKSQKCSTESINQALSRSATRGTAMVVTVSVMFLLLTSPTAVPEYAYSLGKLPTFYRPFMNLTQYLNHSINCVFYCIVGSKFRNELLKLICQNKGPENNYSSRSHAMDTGRCTMRK